VSVIATVPFTVQVDAAQAGYDLAQVLLRLTHADRSTAAGPYAAEFSGDAEYGWSAVDIPDDWSAGFWGVDLGDGSDETFIAVTAGDLGLPWPGVATSPGSVGSFALPTVDQVTRWTGINPDILGQDDDDLVTTLTSLIETAKSETALEVTEDAFYSTSITGDQLLILQKSVAYHAAADFLLSPEVRRLTGTHEPLMVQDGGDLDSAARSLHGRASELSFQFCQAVGVDGGLGDRANRLAMSALRGLR
jgi:hypothetical protein